MALPREYEGFEDALNIVAEIVSTSAGFPGAGSVAIWGIKEVLKDFPVQTHTLKKVLNKKYAKALGIPDDKYEFVLEQTRDALSSIDSVDYNPAVFRKEVFTKNYYFPTLIGSELVEKLHIDEDADLLKAVRFVVAVYLLHWTEEPDFPLEIQRELLMLKSDVEKNTMDIANIKEDNISLNTRVKKLEEVNKKPIPAELTVIPKAITTLIGRESVIQDITSRLETDRILCVTADGGLGKTAIAKKIINNIRNDIVTENCKYKYVAWITSSGNLKEDLLQIRTPDTAAENQEENFKNACRFLLSNPTFLVVDNMDELPTPAEINILNTISGKSTILITTRASTDFSSYELPSLDRDAAVVLFYNNFFRIPAITNITHEKICKETSQIVNAYKIVDATGGNALTIELLAKTAHADHLSVNELWKKFDPGILGFESKTEVQTDHSTRYSKFKLPVDEQMRRLYSMTILSDKQKEIMSFISLFPSEHGIFSNVFKWAGFFEQGADDLEHLVDRGWIIRDEDFYSIHTIVRDSINLQNIKMGDCVSIDKYEGLIKELSNINSYIPRTIDYNLAQKLFFVPQTVGELLSKSLTSSASLGEFYNNLAKFYFDHDKDDEALKFCKLSLEICIKTFGKNHSETAARYNNIALLYKYQHNYDEALQCFQTALEIYLKTLGKDHRSTSTTYDNLASLYQALGNYSEAMKYFNKALEIRENSLGKNHILTATTYNNIASLYRAQGNNDVALNYFRNALDIYEKLQGNDHPDTATIYNNIANVYFDQGNYDESLRLCIMAFEIRKKTLGIHPDTVTSSKMLSALYLKLGNHKESNRYKTIAEEIRKKLGDK